MSRFRISLFVLFLASLTACSYFEETDEREVVVRVNDANLFREDIEALVGEGTSPEDSALIVSNYITRWATQRLLMDRAKLNLSTSRQKEFDEMVENYRNELYTNAYTDAMVSKQLDTALDKNEIEQYYSQNKENFRLSDDLVKIRFIHLDKESRDLDIIKKQFKRFNEEDKKALDKIALQFRNYTFNDSVWVRAKSVYEKVDPLTVKDRSLLLIKSNYIELEDSLSVYLMHINDVLKRDEQAPLEYASSKIKQILLNKRKLNLVKELEKDITKDAIKNKQFEIHD